MKITIVTPSFNQEPYVRDTVESVLSQEGRGTEFELEYIVVDGGSTDGSAEIIREYESELSWWCSEPDRGQSHAINKGLARATGEIVNWLCSDDLLLPGALRTVARHFRARPNVDVLVGGHEVLRPGGLRKICRGRPGELQSAIELIPAGNPVAQPSCFYRRSLLWRSPPLREDLNFAMDLNLWADFRDDGATWDGVERPLSVFRMTGDNKTSTGGFKIVDEIDRVCRAHSRGPLPMSAAYRHTCWRLDRLNHRPGQPWRPSFLWRVLFRGLGLVYARDRLHALGHCWRHFLPGDGPGPGRKAGG